MKTLYEYFSNHDDHVKAVYEWLHDIQRLEGEPKTVSESLLNKVEAEMRESVIPCSKEAEEVPDGEVAGIVKDCLLDNVCEDCSKKIEELADYVAEEICDTVYA